jgi:hypothetical protein
MAAHMKLGAIAVAITAYSAGLAHSREHQVEPGLRMLLDFLREFGDRTVADLAKVVPTRGKGSQETQPVRSDSATLDAVLPHLIALQEAFASEQARSYAVDFKLLINVLRRGDGTNPDSRYLSHMLDALRRALSVGTADEATAAFIDRLNTARGSDAFEDVLAELGASKLKREHVVEIARAVYGGIPKSTSRKAALNFIRKPHDAYMSAKRGIEATGGRSAA